METEQPQAAQIQPVQKNGMAIASMILGILAVLTGLLYIGGVLGIVALILGILSLKKRVGRRMAITGIITGSIGILAAVLSAIIVFTAIPALQRSARDTDRKQQLSLAANDIIKYQTENQGQLPDPTAFGESYQTATIKYVPSGVPATEIAIYRVGEKCDGSKSVRAFTLTVKLENGQIYCLDS